MKSIKQYTYILLLTLPLLMNGCNAYLDVNPKSEVTDKELFATAEGCEDAIYGIYAEIGGERNGLYGQMLAYKYPELMTGNFTINQSDNMSYVVQRQWTHDNAVAIAEEIWTTGYKVIGHVNKALSHILPKSDTEFRHIRLYKGELLALRAFLHFEMARVFAVSFASGDAEAKARAIPYVTTYGIQVTPYSSLEQVFKYIIADLTDAEQYLEEDETLLPVNRDNGIGDFTSNRITHFNLYAVKALLARVYWTMNDLETAEKYAQEVIDCGKFPLKTTAGAWNSLETGTLDMQETIVGLYSTTFTYYYYSDLIRTSASMGSMNLSDQYVEIFEADQEGNPDRRFVAWFDQNNNWCTKHYNAMYASSTSGSTAVYNGNSIPGVSLIRIPEMYYIVAEANLSKDPDKATKYLDKVVTSRDQTAFADRETGHITEENIFNERRKEFFADGGDFHNMKRLARDLTISGMGTFAGNNDATYTMPIPASVEDNYRQ